jgi:hypothetical protein
MMTDDEIRYINTYMDIKLESVKISNLDVENGTYTIQFEAYDGQTGDTKLITAKSEFSCDLDTDEDGEYVCDVYLEVSRIKQIGMSDKELEIQTDISDIIQQFIDRKAG